MPILIAFAVLATLAGVTLAYRAWRQHNARPMLATLACALAATIAWIVAFGAEIGIPLAIETGSLIALGYIMLRAERRDAREPRERTIAPTPLVRGHILRGTSRAVMAGPLGLFAAMAISIAIATRAPIDVQTRLIFAGLLVPSLWAAAILWSLAARRLWRPAAGLSVLGCAGFAIALVPGMMGR